MQQHIIFTGFAGQKTLHDQLEDGEMSVKKGIVKFTEDGILFKDKDGNVEKIDKVSDNIINNTKPAWTKTPSNLKEKKEFDGQIEFTHKIQFVFRLIEIY